MTKGFLIIALLQLSAALNGQRIINNTITAQHRRIDGTNIYIIPPNGFVWLEEHRRFSDSRKANIIINDLAAPVEVVHSQMSERELLGQGLKFLREEPVIINGLKGYCIEASRKTFQDELLIYTLLFGDFFRETTVTHVVQCIFPAGNQVLQEEMERVIATTILKPVIVLAKARFSIDYEKHDFFLWKTADGIDYYRAKQKDGLELVIRVSEFSIKKTQTENDLIFYNQMKRLPYTSVELDGHGIEVIELEGVLGLQATILATPEKGGIEYVYQALLTDGQIYIVLQGISTNPDGLNKIKEVVKTLKKKP